MAITKQNSFEGGTNGTTITTANSDGASGDAFTGVTIASGQAVTFTTSTVYKGGVAAQVTLNSTSGNTFLLYSGLTSASSALRFYFRFSALPAAGTQIVQFSNGTSTLGDLFVSSVGAVAMQLAGTTVWTSTNKLAINTWYRIEAALTAGSTTAGFAQVGYAAGDAALTEQFSTTTGNTGTLAVVDRWLVGRLSSNWATNIFVDDIAVSDSTAFIGPSGGSTLNLLKLGSGAIDSVYLGSGSVSKVYIGANQIWP